ncbi:CHC2 zinc finger domain-containing protein [Marinobacter sp.]|uniref:CHC2 zinc finger domain-containing protein n=1 Tax=Marinobacter sp. TaxID=50741 RepID=UPI003A90CC3D
MARLSVQLIDRIKQEVSLVNLAEAKGLTLKPHGSDCVMCCPFHDDDTASLVITPSKNLWHCMGACQQGGSVVDWVMKTGGVSFRHAVELLRNEFLPLAAESDDEPKVIKQNSTPKLPIPLAANADHQESLRQVIDYYHETLKASPEALEYLESRGLKNSALIDTFKLGYANRALAYRLPQKNRRRARKSGGCSEFCVKKQLASGQVRQSIYLGCA